MNLPIAQIAFL